MFFIQDVKNNKNVTVSGNNIKFEDGTEDWIDDIYIEKYESEEKQ